MKSRSAFMMAAVLLGGVVQHVFAFGPDGHRIVAELAQRRLSPAAANEVGRLLAGEQDTSLANIANWADDVREMPDYRWSAPLHYVNFPRRTCRYQAERDCPDGRCVVGAIERYAAVLGNRKQPFDRRKEALKFLTHFVADLHQPLHAGYADDKGGNLFQVFYLGRGSNLHALWDGGILRSAKRDWRDYADALTNSRQSSATARWSRSATRIWAEESCRLIDTAGIYPKRPGKLEAGYIERQRPVVEQQLHLAGTRLASLLNAVLAGGPPTSAGAGGQVSRVRTQRTISGADIAPD